MELSHPVQSLQDECVKIRRDLHRIPKASDAFSQTRQYLLSYLSALEPDSLSTIAGQGIKAVFLSPCATEAIAFRSSMAGDALEERANVPYTSIHSGSIHASGHDGHMAAGLLLAKLAAQYRAKAKYHLVLLFQPDESMDSAQAMLSAGALSDPPVQQIYAMQVWPSLRRGQLGIRQEDYTACSTPFDLTVLGKSAHGANPDKGVDAVVAAAELINMLQSLFSQVSSGEEPAVLTIGEIEGGEVRNIICDKVVMRGVLRTFSKSAHDRITGRIRDILSGFELATGVTARYEELPPLYCVDHEETLTEAFSQLLPGDTHNVEHFWVGEDFFLYQQQCPGLFFFVGAGEHSNCPSLLSPHFDDQEEVVLYGLEALCRVMGIG